MIKFVGQMSR